MGNNKTYLIKSALGNEITLSAKEDSDFRILSRDGDNLRFLFNSTVHEAQILEYSANGKVLKVVIDNQRLELELQDDLDQLVESMGMNDVSDDLGGDIMSPMPGLILKILVEEGDQVEKGDDILVLEAMKMENLLQAPTTGTVAAIKCHVSDSVNKGDLLVKID